MAEDEGDLVRPLTRLQRLGRATALIVVALIVGGAIFIWSGIYNVGANRHHWGVTSWLITVLREQSITAAAGGFEAPDLSDPGLAALGAEHYRGGCATCHGAPGEELNPIYANMLPQPPDLTHAAERYSPEELFYIIRSGLKYTGMPGWPADTRSDEVWAVVAFLETLNSTGAPADTQQLVGIGAGPVPIRNCVRCHGDATIGTVDDLVPVLNGQSSAYLRRSLEEYREGTRVSGIMMPIAHALSETEIDGLVAFYAGIASPSEPSKPPHEIVDAGGDIFNRGIPEADVPACVSCHIGINPDFPRLEGQSSAYLKNQLQLWRSGLRDVTGPGAIMASIARQMSSQQIDDVSGYLASLPSPLPRTEP